VRRKGREQQQTPPSADLSGMAAAAAPAAGAGKGKRKRALSEDDVYLLLNRSVLPPSLPQPSSSSATRPPLAPPGGSLRARVFIRNPSSPRRYAPGTILTALQEVAQHAEGRRIDWRAVVRKSATGITSAREYQMLWRHFAYNHDLDETVGAGDQPLVRNRTRSSKTKFCCPLRLACKVPMIELGFL